MRIGRHAALTILMACISQACAQRLYLPPRNPPHSGLLQATQPDAQAERLGFALDAGGSTNVQPLLADSTPPFHASQAYFSSFYIYQTIFRMKRWAIGYSYGEASLYQGNRGAARFYREAQQGVLNPDTTYPVQATLNRTAVNALTIAYCWDTPAAQLTLAAHWLTLRRAQYGQLHGQKEGNQFTGELSLHTTRGIAADEIDGQGFALDVALSLRLDRRWRIGFRFENLLSHLSVGTLQQIDARVLVNRPKPDPDGFLHAPPVLEGRTQTRSLHTHAMVSFQSAITYQQSSTSWALMLTHDFRWRMGVALAHTGSAEWWGILWLERPEWQLGVRYAGWELGIGSDQLNWRHARSLTARVQWSLRL